MTEEDEEPADEGATPLLAEQKPRRRGRLYAALAALVLVIALAVAAVAGWIWTQNQYFVKDDGGRVAVYQGVDTDLGPIHLSHLKTRTDIVTADLPSFWQSQVKSGIDASSQAKATQTAERLRAQMSTCLNASDDGSGCSK